MTPRFQHILVPVNLTAKNRPALDIAFDFAVREQARVSLLHVVETLDTGSEPDAELDVFYSRLEQRATSELDSLAQRFVESRVEVEQKIHFGKVTPSIVQFAVDHGVDLIILSSHTIDPERPAKSLSTVSYQVSILCPCPVLMVK